MRNWSDVSNIKTIGDSKKISDMIISELGLVKESFFNTKSDKEKTKIVKIALVNLGHRLGYKVYGNGLRDEVGKTIDKSFVNREWLFDIHWYKDKPHYLTTELLLAAECEWANKRKGDDSNERYSAVKFDFQKLLITNSFLRLLVFKVSDADDEHFKKLDTYFEEAIKTYQPFQEKQRPEFIFICFQENKKKQTILYTQKPDKP